MSVDTKDESTMNMLNLKYDLSNVVGIAAVIRVFEPVIPQRVSANIMPPKIQLNQQ